MTEHTNSCASIFLNHNVHESFDIMYDLINNDKICDDCLIEYVDNHKDSLTETLCSSSKVMTVMAHYHMSQNQINKSIKLYQEAIQKYDDVVAMTNMAIHLINGHNPQQKILAEQLFQRAIDKNNQRAMFYYGSLCNNEYKMMTTKAKYNNDDINFFLGIQYHKKKDLVNAIKYFLLYFHENSQNVDTIINYLESTKSNDINGIYFAIGKYYNEQKDLPKAMKYFAIYYQKLPDKIHHIVTYFESAIDTCNYFEKYCNIDVYSDISRNSRCYVTDKSIFDSYNKYDICELCYLCKYCKNINGQWLCMACNTTKTKLVYFLPYWHVSPW